MYEATRRVDRTSSNNDAKRNFDVRSDDYGVENGSPSILSGPNNQSAPRSLVEAFSFKFPELQLLVSKERKKNQKTFRTL